MEWIAVFGVIVVLMIISLMATHLWVFLCDCVVSFFSFLNPFKKKKEIRWHTLDENTTTKNQNEVGKTKVDIYENEHLNH